MMPPGGQALGHQAHGVFRAPDANGEVRRVLGEKQYVHQYLDSRRAGLRAGRGNRSGSAAPLPSDRAGGPPGDGPDGAGEGGPIFLLGIQRGGTNQVLNILRSHPETTWPQGEFHEVFRWRGLRREGPRAVIAKMARYAPVRIGLGDILDPDRRPPRAGLLAGRRGRAVAAGLAAATAANLPAVMGYKAALREHGLLDGAAAPGRMLVKVMNYNLVFAPDLAALYPGAVFVGLIRDAVAVCEGHVARGASVAAAAEAWAFAAGQLIELEARLKLRVWRFEDLVADTAGVAQAIYGFCGLDPGAARGVCLQDKERIIDAGGRIRGNRKVALFYGFDEMGRHMRADANAGARARMDPAAARAIVARCAPMLRHFGYQRRCPESLTGKGPGDIGERMMSHRSQRDCSTAREVCTRGGGQSGDDRSGTGTGRADPVAAVSDRCPRNAGYACTC